MNWYPLLPADGAVEFPTMGGVTLRIMTRHDGNYECDVLNAHGEYIAQWHVSPDTDIAICKRKSPEQAAQDEAAYLSKLAAIMGIPAPESA